MEKLFGNSTIYETIYLNLSRLDDVLALASSCQASYFAWVVHQAKILRYHVGESDFPGFRHALTAARATRIAEAVCEKLRADPSSTDRFPIRELEGPEGPLRIDDVKRALPLRHLARCAVHMYRFWEAPKSDKSNRGYDLRAFELWWPFASEDYHMDPWQDFSPEQVEDATRRFHEGLYRALIVGAVLAPAYQAPIRKAERDVPNLLFEEYLTRPHNEEWNINDKDVEYMKQFVVYDFNAEPDTLEPYFGELAAWLMEDIKKEAAELRSGRRPGLRLDPSWKASYPYVFTDRGVQRLSLLWPIMMMLASPVIVSSMISAEDGWKRWERDGREYEHEFPEYAHVFTPIQGATRSCRIFLLGIFHMEEVTMPVDVEKSAGSYLLSRPLVRRPESSSPPERYAPKGHDQESTAADVLEIMESIAPGPDDGQLSFKLRFFEFLYKKYFNCKISSTAFARWDLYPSWKRVFSNEVPDVFGGKGGCALAESILSPIS